MESMPPSESVPPSSPAEECEQCPPTPAPSMESTRSSTRSSFGSPVPRKRKRKDEEVEDVLSKQLTAIDKQLNEELNDEAYTYGMSIVLRLRKMNDYQFAVARRDMELAMFNAQFAAMPASNESMSTVTVHNKSSDTNYENTYRLL